MTLETPTTNKEVDVMPLGKRTNEEQGGRKDAGHTKKKGKVKEGYEAKVKKKRGP